MVERRTFDLRVAGSIPTVLKLCGWDKIMAVGTLMNGIAADL